MQEENGMREKGFNIMEQIDREERRRKIKLKLLGKERCENIKNLYMNELLLSLYKYPIGLVVSMSDYHESRVRSPALPQILKVD